MINVSLHRAVVAIVALVITCVLYIWQGSLAAQELPVRLSSLERYRPSAEPVSYTHLTLPTNREV